MKRILLLVLLICFSIVESQAKEIIDSVRFSLYARNAVSAQSAACFDDYVVFVSKKVSRMTLYNLRSKKILYRLNLEPKSEMKGGKDVFHANNSSFGRNKYDEHDPFPLLYVSHRVNNDNRGVMDVYRIRLFYQNRTDDYDSITVEQVQTIYYPVMTDENAMGSPWTAIDPDHDFMYTYSRNNRSKAPNRGKCRLSKFNIPKVSERYVLLNDSDIIESSDLKYNAPCSQGACIYRGMMYIAQGVPQKNGKAYLRVVDLKRSKLIRTYNLHTSGFDEEPEGCFIYDGKLMLTTTKKNIYQLEIPIE